MPCPDFNVCIVKRSENKSVVAAAAYQSCSRLHSEYDNKVKNYVGKRHELVHEEIMLPKHAPPKFSDRQTLWNSVEMNEKNWNAQLARRFRMAIPREVPADQYVAMVREFCQEQFVKEGMICDFAIHDKGDGNPHAHILLTLRSLDENGKWCPKSRKEYVFDEDGERIRLPSGRWKTRKVEYNDWNNKANCEKWRHAWESVQNKYLEMNDRPERVDLRSYARQGIDQIPTVHMGPAVAAMEEKGIRTDIGDLNREIKERNSLMQSIRNMIRGLKNWITELAEERQELVEALSRIREPTLTDLVMKWLNLRADERQGWSGKAQLNGTVSDAEKAKQMISFLQAKGIVRLEDLDKNLAELEAKASHARKSLKFNEKRYKTIRKIKDASADLRKYKPVHDAYMKKGFKLSKDRYKEAHKDELDAYNRAYRILMREEQTTDVSVTKFDSELKTRKNQDAKNQEILDSVKDDLEQMKSIRYCIDKVLPREPERAGRKEKRSIHDRLSETQVRADQQNAKRDQARKKKQQNMEL